MLRKVFICSLFTPGLSGQSEVCGVSKKGSTQERYYVFKNEAAFLEENKKTFDFFKSKKWVCLFVFIIILLEFRNFQITNTNINANHWPSVVAAAIFIGRKIDKFLKYIVFRPNAHFSVKNQQQDCSWLEAERSRSRIKNYTQENCRMATHAVVFFGVSMNWKRSWKRKRCQKGEIRFEI